MLITIKDAIERAMLYEDKHSAKPFETPKGDLGAWPVRNVLTTEAHVIRELLVAHEETETVYFPDNLSADELDKEIDQFVIKELSKLATVDPLTPPAPLKARFSEEQIKQLTAKDISLLPSLQSTIDQLTVDPYQYIGVKQFLPALVALENLKKPDLDLHLSYNADTLTKIDEWVKDGREHGSLIHVEESVFDVGPTRIDYYHANYFDYKLVAGKPSILWMDSWKMDTEAKVFREFQANLKAACPGASIGGVELRNQSAAHGCPIFAINSAKQVYKDPKGLDALHQKNINLLPIQSRKIYSDPLLAAHFMKHTQSNGRLLEYFKNNPKERAMPVNDKFVTAAQYRQQHLLKGKFDVGLHMRSIYEKRLTCLIELRDALGISVT